MTCGCTASIGEKDSRAELWIYIFGNRSFPLLGPLSYNMGDIVGIGYKGDAKALNSEQRERLIEKMTEKFNIKRADVEEHLKDGVVPIKAEGVTLSICRAHFMMAVLDSRENDSDWDESERDEDQNEDEESLF